MRKLIIAVVLLALPALAQAQAGQYIEPCARGACLAGHLAETGGSPRYGERVGYVSIKYTDTTKSITLPPGACVKAAYFITDQTGFDGTYHLDIGDANAAAGYLANANITKTANAQSGGAIYDYGAYLYGAGTPGPNTNCYPNGGTVLVAPTPGTVHTGSGTAYVVYDELPVVGTPKSTSTPTRTPTYTSTPTRTPTPTPT